jgi:hypothetical protein
MNDVIQQVLNNIPVVLEGYPVRCKTLNGTITTLTVFYSNVILANIDFYHVVKAPEYIYNLWIPFDNYMDMELRNKVIDKLRTYLEMMGFTKL